MLAFDWAAGGLLAASAAIGLARGATREVTSIVALVIAAILAIAVGRFGDPLLHRLIHPDWLARPAGMAVVFVIAYVALRLIGGLLTRGVRDSGLSGLDRVLGLTLGLGRGLAALGAFALLLGAFVPAQRTPPWIGRARLYPLALGAGAALRAAAPHALSMARLDTLPAHAGPASGSRSHSLEVVEDPR
ncbi:MAG TPA: CvpA family protein [Caulobacteraceae bacterium]|jgi:membrane protein required for colicin V production